MPSQRRHRPLRKPRSKSAVPRALPDVLPLWPDATQPIAEIELAKPTSHPNIFRKRIQKIEGHPAVGEWVRVMAPPRQTASAKPSGVESESGEATRQDESSRFEHSAEELQTLGYGWYNPKSEIAVRMVSWSAHLPDEHFWQQLTARAVSLRQDVLALDRETNCYRVAHAEADGLPGLVIDRYGDCLSAEIFSASVAPRAQQIVQMFAQQLGTEHTLIQPGPHLMSQDGYDFRARASDDLPRQVTVEEEDVKFVVNFEDSHKTGFFCDQRENRQRLAKYCHGKSVLDVCCYTGGFAVTAAKQGEASSVVGVDLDAAPLEVAKRNAAINQTRVKFTQADAFAYMRDMLRQKRQFDVVVLDPPKLIRNRRELEEGTRKHFDLNRLAMQLVAPGGIMLTCSCAGLLQSADFTRLVRAAARSAFLPTDFNPDPEPRMMQILGQNGASACHPVSANCPETEYLKAMWLRL